VQVPEQPPRPPSRRLGPDGIVRLPAEEERLDRVVQAAFAGEHGRQALAYLRSITIEMVAGPNVTDAELRHREGMRALVGIIETRLRRRHPS
jgi:hypothetical protein